MHLHLGRGLLISKNPLGHATVVSCNSLQEIVIYIKSNPKAEEREFILYALLHILLDCSQLELTFEIHKKMTSI